MGKVEKVKDTLGGALPLRITQRKARGKRSAHFRVGCGCCNEGLVIFPPENVRDFVEINGVNGSVDQWRQIFGKLLWMQPRVEFPRFGMKDKASGKVSYVSEIEAARLWRYGLAELTNELMDSDFSIRELQIDEYASLNVIADHIEEYI